MPEVEHPLNPNDWPTRPYARRFRRIHREVVLATREVARFRPWRRPLEEQVSLANAWARGVGDVYGFDAPAVVIDGQPDCYVPSAHRVHLSRFSIVSLAHEVRHAMQHRGVAGTRSPSAGTNAIEDDARAWSLSLFRAACPRRFERMRLAGRLLYVDPRPADPAPLADAPAS